MTSPRICHNCGAELPPSTPLRLCPRCTFAQATSAIPLPKGEDLQDDNTQSKSPPLPGESGTRQVLGDYELLELIGRGGMGIVYKARQRTLNRIVAVKLLASGSLASAEAVHRFRTEAVAAGSLHHPNIVAVYEVGLAERQHYLVMDYVAGPTLENLVREGLLPGRQAARLIQLVADAVHFAHEHGILHRDLKPSNVLLEADDQPRVTDFGLAKRLEDSQVSTFNPQLTLSGQALGSPAYMSPEQASGRRGCVGRRSDVYGLGAILYFLLTGRAPFAGGTVADLLHAVLNREPVAPRLLNPAAPADLETICLKCLEREPARRYPTSRAVAEELGRFLRHEPIIARPLGLPGKALRWCRRKPLVAGLAATAVGLVLVIAIGSPLAVYRINHQRRTALAQTRLAELTAYAANINLAQQYLKAGNLGRARDLLALASRHSPHTPDLHGWEWDFLNEQAKSNAEFVLERLSTAAKLFISPDSRYLAVGLRYAQFHLWDLPARQIVGVLGQEADLPAPAAFSPDSRFFGYKEFAPDGINKYVLWDLARNARKLELTSTNFLGPLVFVPGRLELIGGQLAPDRRRQTALWDLETRQIKACFSHSTSEGDLHKGNDLRVTSDGHLFIGGDIDGKIVFLNARDLQPLGSVQAHLEGISALVLSPDNRVIATAQAYSGTEIKLWDLENALECARKTTSPEPL